RAGRAPLLLRLAAGGAHAAAGPFRRRGAQTRAAILRAHAQLQRRAAAGQGLTARAAAGHVRAAPAAAGVADRARLSVDAAGGQDLAAEHAALAALGAAAAAALVALRARLARGPTVRDHHARAGHAGAAAAVRRGGAGLADGRAGGAAASARGATER